jgi:threonine dehydratase
VLVSGGNIGVSLLARIIVRGLIKDGRLPRVRVYLQDRPGAMTIATRGVTRITAIRHALRESGSRV